MNDIIITIILWIDRSMAAASFNNNSSSSKRRRSVEMQMSWQPNYQLLRRRKLGLPPLGLKNLGNSCYLNSVLQCLSYTPPLAHFCLTHTHSSICTAAAANNNNNNNSSALPLPPPPPPPCTTPSSSDDPDGGGAALPPVCPLCLLERQISLSHTSLLHDSPLVPSKIRRYLRLFARHFRLGRQEDAHEFLRFLIDACHIEAKKQQQQPLPKHINDNVTHHRRPQSHPSHSVFQQIFGGSLLNQVKCLSCGAESNKFDEFMDISLDIFHSSSLLDSLRAFFNPELLDGSNKYQCQSCGKLSPARKQMFLLQAPNILVIQLKRFEGIHGGKIDRPIAFQETLKLSSYMSKSSQDQQPVYQLFGSVVHSGYSPESGHYYAYIKDTAGCWYCCNDSLVSLSTLEEVLSERAYILFFSRANQNPGKDPNSELGSASNGVHNSSRNGYDKFGMAKVNVSSKQQVDGQYGPQICQRNILSIAHKGELCSEQKAVFDDQKLVASKKFANANEKGNMEDSNVSGGFPVETHYVGTPPERRKRKLIDSEEVKSDIALADPRHVFREDANRGSEMEKFQQRLVNEASMTLRSCGWVDNVQNFMRGRKRIHAELLEDGAKLKKLLIADARKIFLSQVPESLKEDLIQRLRSIGSRLLDA